MKRLFTLVLSALVLSVCAFASPEAVDNAVEVDLAEFYSDAELMSTYGDLTYSVSNGKVTITDCSTSVTSVTIPSTINGYPVTSIGSSAFYNCSSLARIEIPDSVTSIGNSAFYNCSSLESVEIGDSVTSIGDWAFNGCTNLFFVYITDLKAWCEIDCKSTPLRDGAKLFLDGKAIKGDVVIPEGTTKIGNYSFYYCKDITSVAIPDSVTSVGSNAFYYCSSLASVEIGDSVTSIGSYAFEDCSSLASIEIPDSVTSIGSYAFSYCSSLASVEIGDSVTSIGRSAFYYCSSLEAITVDENNTKYCSDERGVLFDKNKTTLIQYPRGNKATSYIIPDSVTSIGSYAFKYCSSLARIEIPDSVTSIGDWAFEYCSSLEKVTVLSRDVIFYWSVFYYCDNLTIYGYTGSTSEAYAAEYDIPFIDLDSIPPYTPGDLGGDGEIDASDAILLLQYSMFPELYPLDYAGDVDFIGDGEVDISDAILLLQHSMFPDLYPID